MGSFSYTCCLSGLPIDAGDRVRYLLLTENPYTDEVGACYMHDNWFVRTLPLKARYNDYGSVEKVEGGPARKAWLTMLAQDVVPRGWGDNACHDVPVRKRMKFHELLNAVQEGRVRVRRDVGRTPSVLKPPIKKIAFDVNLVADDGSVDTKEVITTISENLAFRLAKLKFPEEAKNNRLVLRESAVQPERAPLTETQKLAEELFSGFDSDTRQVPDGVPTRQRVEQALVAAGLVLYGGYSGKAPEEGSFSVDKKRFGEVRVRFECLGSANFGKDPEFLKKAEAALGGKYATMICAGSGNYASSADLWVRPHPGTKDFYGIRNKDKKTPLQVVQAMIREDVWRALLTLKVDNWRHMNGNKAKYFTIEDYYKAADEFVEEVTRITKEETERWEKLKGSGGSLDVDFMIRMQVEPLMQSNMVAAWIAKDVIPFTNGPAAHWALLAREGHITPALVKLVAEFAFIQAVLSAVRYWWRPSYSCGPQNGEWEYHQRFLEALVSVNQPHAEEHRKKREDSERWLAEYARKDAEKKSRATKKKKAEARA